MIGLVSKTGLLSFAGAVATRFRSRHLPGRNARFNLKESLLGVRPFSVFGFVKVNSYTKRAFFPDKCCNSQGSPPCRIANVNATAGETAANPAVGGACSSFVCGYQTLRIT